MMHTKQTAMALAGLITVSLSAIPNVANAYLTPEEVLLENPFLPGTTTLAPPNARAAQGRADQQAAAAEADRNARQEAYFGAQESLNPAAPAEGADNTPADDSELNQVLLDLANTLQQLQGGEGQVVAPAGALTPEEERLLQRIRRNQLAGDTTVLRAPNNEVLHSGAPLTDTGAGHWVLAIALAIGAGFVLRRTERAMRVR